MKGLFTALLSLAALIFLLGATPSLAESHKLGAKPSEFELAGACQAAGGSYFNDSAANGLPHGYGCTVKNCDGKGGDCSVTCGTGGCTGTTPDAPKMSSTLLMILQDGSNVSHVYEQNEGPSTPNHKPTPTAPSNPGIIFY